MLRSRPQGLFPAPLPKLKPCPLTSDSHPSSPPTPQTPCPGFGGLSYFLSMPLPVRRAGGITQYLSSCVIALSIMSPGSTALEPISKFTPLMAEWNCVVGAYRVLSFCGSIHLTITCVIVTCDNSTSRSSQKRYERLRSEVLFDFFQQRSVVFSVLSLLPPWLSLFLRTVFFSMLF